MQRFGRYRILEELARGGMGVVYRAEDETLGREVALKVLLAGAHASENQRKRFLREAHAVARLDHPGIVPVWDVGEAQGRLYMAMELIPGETLQRRLDLQGMLPPRVAVEFAVQVGRAVEHAHARDVLHRDLKPDNVLIDPSGRARLMDFGLAQQVRPGEDRLTRTGQFLGTPGYWAPEQALGKVHSIGPTTDVYGLGALLYGLLADRPPHTGSLGEVLDRVDQIPDPPSQRNPAVDGVLDQIVLCCLAHAPQDRYFSIGALVEDLEGYLAGAETGGGLPGVLPWMGVLLAVVLAGAGLAGFVSGVEAEPSSPSPALAPSAAEAESGPALTPSQAPQGDEAEAERLFAKGWALQGEGDMELALRYYDRCLELNPSNPMPWHNRALIRFKRGEREGAYADISKAIELDPLKALSVATRGGFYLEEGKSKQALVDLNRAHDMDPKEATWTYQRGLARKRLGDLQGAWRDYEAALQLNPSLAKAWNSRGVLKVAKKDLVGAIADYTRAIEIDPHDPSAFENRSWALRDRGDLRGAIADARRVLEIDPKWISAWKDLVVYYETLKDLPRALECASEGLRLAPTLRDLRAKRASLRTAAGDHRGAIADFDRVIASGKADAVDYGNRGMAKRRLGDLAGAEADYSQALRLSSTQAQPFYNRALVRGDRGNLAGAIQDLDKVLSMKPAWGGAGGARGVFRVQARDYRGAIPDFNKAIALGAANADVYYARAVAKGWLQDLGGARADFRAALRLYPRGHPRIAEVQSQLKNVEAALAQQGK